MMEGLLPYAGSDTIAPKVGMGRSEGGGWWGSGEGVERQWRGSGEGVELFGSVMRAFGAKHVTWPCRNIKKS